MERNYRTNVAKVCRGLLFNSALIKGTGAEQWGGGAGLHRTLRKTKGEDEPGGQHSTKLVLRVCEGGFSGLRGVWDCVCESRKKSRYSNPKTMTFTVVLIHLDIKTLDLYKHCIASCQPKNSQSAFSTSILTSIFLRYV